MSLLILLLYVQSLNALRVSPPLSLRPSQHSTQLGAPHHLAPSSLISSSLSHHSKKQEVVPRSKEPLQQHAKAIEVTKSPSDPHLYRFETLSNGLNVLLISDPKSPKAAAALDVGVGHYSDPAEVPGLAHFLEHMLFLGTKKYPEEGEYAEFIASHGGTHNAYTAEEHTNFVFDIFPHYLSDALDRFAQFFTAPLLTESAMGREMHAVDAEHRKNFQDDGWRLGQLMGELAIPELPLHQFGTGNLKTLGNRSSSDLNKVLKEFHGAHYIPTQMNLVVLGTEDLDTLSHMVTNRFTEGHLTGNESAQRNATIATPLQPIFPDSHLTKVVLYQRRSAPSYLTLLWALPTSINPEYGTKSLDYILNLLGAEGPGSLVSLLKRKGWVEGVSISLESSSHICDLLSVNFDLTPEVFPLSSSSPPPDPLVKVYELIHAFFRYLQLVATEGIEYWRYQEMGDARLQGFHGSGKTNPYDYVQTLAANMRLYEPSDLLTGGALFDHYDPDGMRNLLSHLHPNRMVVLLGGSLAEVSAVTDLDSIEPWYHIPYAIRSIPASSVAEWVTLFPFSNPDIKNPSSPSPPSPSAPAHPSSSSSISYASSYLNDNQVFYDSTFIQQSSLSTVLDKLMILPLRNSFHVNTHQFDVKPLSSKNRGHGCGENRPRIISKSDDPLVRIWWLHDQEFRQPEVNMRCRYWTSLPRSSPRASVLTQLYQDLVGDYLSEFTTVAGQAGYSYSADYDTSGLTLQFNGYNQLPLLLRFVEVVSRAFAFSPHASSLSSYHGADSSSLNEQDVATGFSKTLAINFHLMKKEHLERYANFKYGKPHHFAKHLLYNLEKFPSFSMFDYVAALLPLTIEDVLEWQRQLHRDTLLECLVHGDILEHEAKHLVEVMQKSNPFTSLSFTYAHLDEYPKSQPLYAPLHPPALRFHSDRVAKLDEGQTFTLLTTLLNEEDANSVSLHVYQMGECFTSFKDLEHIPEEVRKDVLHLYLQLLDTVLDRATYYQLRTVEQLGYIVHSYLDRQSQIESYNFFVQSGVYSSDHVRKRIEHFIQNYYLKLASLSSPDFHLIIETIETLKTQPLLTLEERNEMLWIEISTQQYKFDRREVQAQLIKQYLHPTASFQTFLSIYRSLFRIDTGEHSHNSYHGERGGAESCRGGLLKIGVEPPPLFMIKEEGSNHKDKNIDIYQEVLKSCDLNELSVWATSEEKNLASFIDISTLCLYRGHPLTFMTQEVDGRSAPQLQDLTLSTIKSATDSFPLYPSRTVFPVPHCSLPEHI